MFGKENVVYLLAESTNVLNGKSKVQQNLTLRGLFQTSCFIHELFIWDLDAYSLYIEVGRGGRYNHSLSESVPLDTLSMHSSTL